jgi:anaerobic selenocysteine-containing dehydrogenase
LCADGEFPTPDGKARFRAVPLPQNGVLARSSHGPRLFSVASRRGKQFNSLIYAEVDPINGAPRDAVFMNPQDAAGLNLAQNDRVALSNQQGRFEGRVFLAPMAPGNLQVHWPEGNSLLRRGVVEPSGGSPDYNARVKVEHS